MSRHGDCFLRVHGLLCVLGWKGVRDGGIGAGKRVRDAWKERYRMVGGMSNEWGDGNRR